MRRCRERDVMMHAIRQYVRLGLNSGRLNSFEVLERIRGSARTVLGACRLLAVRDMIEVLKVTGREETLRIVDAVYCQGKKDLHRNNEVSMRVIRYAMTHHCDERTVYRHLEAAKKLFEACYRQEAALFRA